MEATLFLRNKLKRHIDWSGQELTFYRSVKNEYGELTDEIEQEFSMKALYHDGGGYGGMVNIEILERDGGRTFTRMKPMVMCLYEDGIDIQTDDWIIISENRYRVVDKLDIKNLNVVFEISLELDYGRE